MADASYEWLRDNGFKKSMNDIWERDDEKELVKICVDSTDGYWRCRIKFCMDDIDSFCETYYRYGDSAEDAYDGALKRMLEYLEKQLAVVRGRIDGRKKNNGDAE